LRKSISFDLRQIKRDMRQKNRPATTQDGCAIPDDSCHIFTETGTRSRSLFSALPSMQTNPSELEKLEHRSGGDLRHGIDDIADNGFDEPFIVTFRHDPDNRFGP